MPKGEQQQTFLSTQSLSDVTFETQSVVGQMYWVSYVCKQPQGTGTTHKLFLFLPVSYFMVCGHLGQYCLQTIRCPTYVIQVDGQLKGGPAE